jgi:hypothetical protein
MDEQHHVVVESSRQYALAEAGDEFVVYARSDPDTILGRFPGDEDGFTKAEDLYRTLVAPYRWKRYTNSFLVLFFTALVVHVLSVAILYLLQASQGSSFEANSTLIVVVERWSSAAANISNTVWIAALAGMAGIWLAQHVFKKGERPV